MKPAAPRWFGNALAQQPERSFIEVEGAAIETLSWGPRGAPGLLLLHGSRASADWWSFLAPLLMADFRVAAFSMSGMGGSAHRSGYAISQFAREAIEVAESTGLFQGSVKPMIIAHSFGGYAALRASCDLGERLGGIVLVDSIIIDLEAPERKWAISQPEPRRSYPSLEAAIARFRLMPSRATEALWALDHVARSSVRHDSVTGDWTWRFDPALFSRIAEEDLGDLARKVLVPIAIVRGEDSVLIDQAMRDYTAETFGGGIPDIVIPDAGHHIMIDQPLALVAALRSLLATWPPDSAGRRSALGPV